METRSFDEAVIELKDELEPRIAEAKRDIVRWSGRATDYVKRYPAAFLIGAIATGYVVARAARRLG